MGRKDEVWQSRWGYVESTVPAGEDVLIKWTDRYLNRNTVTWTSWYGIRDSSGVMELKNSWGSWAWITALWTPTLTAGSVLFAWATWLIAQDNSSFYFDNTNNRLGLLSVPTHTLTLGSTGTGIAIYNTADQTTNFERLSMAWESNSAVIKSQPGGTGAIRALVLGCYNNTWGTTTTLTINRNSVPWFSFSSANSGNTWNRVQFFSASHNMTAASGTQVAVCISPAINQTSTAWFTTLLINPTLTAQGSWLQLLQDWQAWGTSQAVMTAAGLFGMKTTAPTHSITLGSTATWIALYNTADQVTNFERFRAYWSSNVFFITTGSWGTWTTRQLSFIVYNAWSDGSWSGVRFDISRSNSTAYNFTWPNSPTQLSNWFQVNIDMANTISTGVATWLRVTGNINQSSTAWYTILDLNPTISAEWSWAKNFILCRKASGTTLFWVDSNGVIYFDRTYTAAWTTTTQTINKPSWSVNVAAWWTSVTVNNSLVTTSSLVNAVILTNDTTAQIKNVVPSAWSFVITFAAAVTAETAVWRFIVNT